METLERRSICLHKPAISPPPHLSLSLSLSLCLAARFPPRLLAYLVKCCTQRARAPVFGFTTRFHAESLPLSPFPDPARLFFPRLLPSPFDPDRPPGRVISVTSPPPPSPPSPPLKTVVADLRRGLAVLPGGGAGLQAALCGKRGRRALRASEGLSDEVSGRGRAGGGRGKILVVFAVFVCIAPPATQRGNDAFASPSVLMPIFLWAFDAPLAWCCCL